MTRKPVVYSIAGSDCSGGAGLQADLLTLHALGTHACTLTTALTAQNRQGVLRIMPSTSDQLRAEFSVLLLETPPAAIKIGMLATHEIASTVNELLRYATCPVVCDPVIEASAGGALLTETALSTLLQLFPVLTLLTPNAHEAQLLSGIAINDYAAVEAAAQAMLANNLHAVLITCGDLNIDPLHRYDYFASQYERFWLRSPKIDTPHTHGTGCTLSSAIAAFLAHGHALTEAIVMAKMTINAALQQAQPIGTGSGAVAHPRWDEVVDCGISVLPQLLTQRPDAFTPLDFPRCRPLGLYPVVHDVTWIEKLLTEGVTTTQLRLKGCSEKQLRSQIQRAVALQQQYGAQVFINDYWQLAIEYGAFGVHLGQEDLHEADLAQIAAAGLRLGTSNHSWQELARSHALSPSYQALGPIYSTTTKVMRFPPRGLTLLGQWVRVLKDRYPLTAIGGIDLQRTPKVLGTGVGSVAVVRALLEASDYQVATSEFQRLLAAAEAAFCETTALCR